MIAVVWGAYAASLLVSAAAPKQSSDRKVREGEATFANKLVRQLPDAPKNRDHAQHG